MADTRKLKVYEAWGRNYRPVPEIILKGDWLKQYGFTEDTPIHVHCEDGKLTITPRDPDPVPDKIGNILEEDQFLMLVFFTYGYYDQCCFSPFPSSGSSFFSASYREFTLRSAISSSWASSLTFLYSA